MRPGLHLRGHRHPCLYRIPESIGDFLESNLCISPSRNILGGSALALAGADGPRSRHGRLFTLQDEPVFHPGPGQGLQPANRTAPHRATGGEPVVGNRWRWSFSVLVPLPIEATWPRSTGTCAARAGVCAAAWKGRAFFCQISLWIFTLLHIMTARDSFLSEKEQNDGTDHTQTS